MALSLHAKIFILRICPPADPNPIIIEERRHMIEPIKVFFVPVKEPRPQEFDDKALLGIVERTLQPFNVAQ